MVYTFIVRNSRPISARTGYQLLTIKRMVSVESPPNIQLNWIKRFKRAKKKRYFEDYKDGSRLYLINFDFVIGYKEFKGFILVKF